MVKFPHFQDEWLRDLQPEVWVPAEFKRIPFNIFETGGTTEMPKQRIGWNDYKSTTASLARKIADEHFPRGGAWLMMGPTAAPPAPRDRTSRPRARIVVLLHRSRSSLREGS